LEKRKKKEEAKTEEGLEAEAETEVQQRDEVVQVLQQRIRYLLTLKGRPPFRLAGIEMYDRLSEVNACLQAMLDMHSDARLRELQQGLEEALSEVQDTYHDLHQAANWLEEIADLLDPEGKPERTGQEVREQLFDYLDAIQEQGQDNPVLNDFASHISKTTRNYAPGLFHTYDLEDLPRTNNERESEFRGLIRQVLRTTGQKGATRRIILRSGAWEVIPHPGTLEQTVEALSSVDPDELQHERTRVCNHRKRFRTHTRSVKQSQKQLEQLKKQWGQLAHREGAV
jgi:hypothetical protein